MEGPRQRRRRGVSYFSELISKSLVTILLKVVYWVTTKVIEDRIILILLYFLRAAISVAFPRVSLAISENTISRNKKITSLPAVLSRELWRRISTCTCTKKSLEQGATHLARKSEIGARSICRNYGLKLNRGEGEKGLK